MSKHGKSGKSGKGSARKKVNGTKAQSLTIETKPRSRLTLPGLVAVAIGVVLVAGITSLWRIRR